MEIFKFTEQCVYSKDNNSFIAHIENINGEDSLFHELFQKLQFPDYFGYNWNAVYDCLCDLNWIDNKKIVLLHYQQLNVSKETLKVYIEVLFDAVQTWKNYEEHELEVVFSYDQKQMIMDILESINSQKGIN